MPAFSSQSEREILTTLAEYRLLTIGQLTRLLDLHPRTARAQVSNLELKGLIEASSGLVETERTRGRPEKLLALSNVGVDALKAEHLLDEKIAKEHLTGGEIRCIGHQLLLNSFRIHLQELEDANPEFGVHFLSSNSPFAALDNGGQPLIQDKTETQDSGHTIFLPDGAFSITHRSRQKTLLFLLEVDMGTQTISGSHAKERDIRHKVVTYQSYFRTGTYKRYEQIFNAELRGFRLLFLTHTPTRLTALCRLVAAARPSDFIWLTDHARMIPHGVGGAIWVRGGRMDAPHQSILGSEMPRSLVNPPSDE